MPHPLRLTAILRSTRITALLLGLLLTLVGRATAQPTLTIGINTRLTGTGPVRLVYGGGALTNNGSLSLPAGQLTATGPLTYGGTGTATVATALFNHSTGSSTLNSLLSVTDRATLSTNASVNANGQLYLRTDGFPNADLVNDGKLVGTVQGLVTKATVTSGSSPYNSQLSTNVSGSVMKYQWQSSPDNSLWSNVPGATSATYTASVDATIYFRCSLTASNNCYDQNTPGVQLAFTATATAPVAPTLLNQTATMGTFFSYVVPAFTGTPTITYTAENLPDGLKFDANSRTISGKPITVQNPTVTIGAKNEAGTGSGTFVITVKAATQPTGPATLTITSFTCFSTNGALSSVDFVVGYSDGTFAPAVNDLFLNGLTITGKLGVQYSLNFDANGSTLPVQDQATRSTYFVWNYRQACTNPVVVNPFTPTAPVAPALANLTATQGTFFSYVVPAFTGTPTITYSASGLPDGLSFDADTRTISGTPTTVQTPTATITATNAAGKSSGQFTIAVSSPSVTPVTPTGPATLTITSFTCFSTNGALSSVNFVVGYPGGTTGPAVGDLFINGITITGKLGQQYGLSFDANQSNLSVADQATRQVYFVWNYRQACTSAPVTPPAPTLPVAPTLPNQTAIQGTYFSYTVPGFGGTAPITYAASNLPNGLSFDVGTRTISGTPTTVQTPTVTITATNVAGQTNGQFTFAVSASAVTPPTPTGPATLTITSFTCHTTNSVLSSVDFVVGYSDGTFAPAVPNLFINGITITGQLGTQYALSFDANQSLLTIQDQASRSTYFVWDYRQACTQRNSRLSAETPAPWQVTVLGNPTTDTWADVVVSHAQGLSLQIRVVDMAGHVVSEHTTPVNADTQSIRTGLSTQAGLYLIQVSDGVRQQSLRVLQH